MVAILLPLLALISLTHVSAIGVGLRGSGQRLETDLQLALQYPQFLQDPEFQLTSDPDATSIGEESEGDTREDSGIEKPVYEYAEYYENSSYARAYGEMAESDLPGEEDVEAETEADQNI